MEYEILCAVTVIAEQCAIDQLNPGKEIS